MQNNVGRIQLSNFNDARRLLESELYRLTQLFDNFNIVRRLNMNASSLEFAAKDIRDSAEFFLCIMDEYKRLHVQCVSTDCPNHTQEKLDQSAGELEAAVIVLLKRVNAVMGPWKS